jgi:hypothetical protein
MTYEEELINVLKELGYKRTKLSMEGKISKEDYEEVRLLIRKLYGLLELN